MKCDELTPIDLECNMGKDINGVEHREPWKAYDIDEVNAAIAELKAEINRKDGVKQRWFERCMEARTENINLKRALWLMTAEWAEAMGLASCNIAAKFMSREKFEVSDDYRNKTIKKYRHRQVVFYKYADYCRQKAEQFKEAK